MSQMTLRNIPAPIEKKLRRLARAKGKSLNATAIHLLGQSLGTTAEGPKKRDLSRFFGTWTEEEASEFEESTRGFREIDSDIWK